MYGVSVIHVKSGGGSLNEVFLCPRGGMADTADLKSDVERRVGSNPTGGTYFDIFKKLKIFQMDFSIKTKE